MEFEGIWGQCLQLEVNKMAEAFFKIKHFFFTDAIEHAPRIILWAFTGTNAIVPVSWQALLNCSFS
jgi:hypothetical protein